MCDGTAARGVEGIVFATSLRRTLGYGLLAVGALGAPALIASSSTAAPTVAPTPAAPKPGKATTVAVVGDSITQSTGTGPLSKENPVNSWATGTGVNSLAARLGIPTDKRYNYCRPTVPRCTMPTTR